MVKKILFSICLSACFQPIMAQSLMHSFGATMTLLTGQQADSYSSSRLTMTQTYLSYFPRYNFVEGGNSSISIGAPVGLGVGLATNTYGGDIGVAFSYDLPLVIDYNIGFKSSYENDGTFGGYLAAGFAYNYVSVSASKYSDFKTTTYGPIFRGGVRIGSVQESWGGHGITIGVFYKKDLQENPFDSFGMNVYYDL